MGLLDEFKRLAHPYEDEEEDDYDEYDAPAPRAERQDRSDRSDRADRAAERAERRERTGSLYGSAPMLDEERRSNKVVNIRAATQLQVVLVKPEKFEDASSIADHLREKRTVVSQLMTVQQGLEAIRAMARYDASVDVFWQGKAYADPENLRRAVENADPSMRPYIKNSRTVVPDMAAWLAEQSEGPEKISMFFARVSQREEAQRQAEAMGLEVTSSLPTNLELNAGGVNKGRGLLALAKALGFAREQVMAYGDSGNDAAMLKAVGLDDVKDELATALPYGKQRRLEIARALATDPKLLLLDEPAAGMNPQETIELTNFIRSVRDEFGLTIFLIEHHMNLVMDISDRIYVIDFGKQIAAGVPAEIQNDQRVIDAYLGVDEDA